MSHVREFLARDPLDLTERDRTHIDEHLASCAECRALAAGLARSDRLLTSAEPRLTIPSLRGRATERTSPLLLAGAGAIALIAVLALVPILASRADRAAAPASSPSPSAVAASPTSAASPHPTASPAATPRLQGVFENRILGYRLTLPDGYRAIRPFIFVDDETNLGGDYFTTQTEAEERRACLEDIGHTPRMRERPDLHMSVLRNPRGLSAAEYATTPTATGFVLATHARVEPLTIGGHDAVRLAAVDGGRSRSYVIRANDRMYILSMPMIQSTGPLETPLDEVARTFTAVRPVPPPTPTPTPAAETIEGVAGALARAFATRDADAVARLTTGCWISYTHTIDGEVVGMGGQGRSVPRFTEGLRERFARGDLTVTVDPTVRTGRDGRYVRSEWREPDRTRAIDLYLTERDGRWVWSYAQHHYLRGDFGPPCGSYRVPWSSIPGC